MRNHKAFINAELFEAVKANETPRVGVLLEKGADPNAEESFLFRGYQPYRRRILHALLRATDLRGFAVEIPENIEVLLALLEAGADVNAQDTSLFTPLRLAVLRSEWQKTICLLLDQGADIERSDNQGQTPLHVACFRMKSAPVMNELLKRGACVNAQTKFGSTALMHAVNRLDGATERVRLLLEFGADPSIRNRHGRTVIDQLNERSSTPETTDLIQLITSALEN